MRVISRLLLPALAAAAMLLATGCGGDDDDSSSSSAKTPSTAATTTAAPAASEYTTGTPGPEGVPLALGEPLAAPEGDGETKDGIKCQTTEQLVYHVHSHLAIFVAGKPRQVPLAVGIARAGIQNSPQGPFAAQGTCFHWLHTHASDGIVHVEAPAEGDYTLGQFFAVWGQPLSTTQVGPAKGRVTAYLDGKKYAGDPADIKLENQAVIQLDVGTPLVPPQPVEFPEGL